jgi:hypothetical protein
MYDALMKIEPISETDEETFWCHPQKTLFSIFDDEAK